MLLTHSAISLFKKHAALLNTGLALELWYWLVLMLAEKRTIASGYFSRIKPENLGGIIGTLGSLLVVAAGDAEGFISTACFLVSGYIFSFYGHKNLGYSLGCLGLCIGDALLCFSHATASNPSLQFIVAMMAAMWGLGSLRYALGRADFSKTSAVIPAAIASINFMLRMPTLYAAAFTGEHLNILMFICNILWGLSDVLLGRVHLLIGDYITMKNPAAFLRRLRGLTI